MKNQFLSITVISLIFIFFCLTQGNEKTKYSNITQSNKKDSTTFCDNLAGLPPVGDQVVGGSCYAWAAAYYYLTHLQWQEYGWDVTDPAHQCSPAFIYNLTNGGIDNGAWEGDSARADAFKVLRTMGCATMADMPYNYTQYRTFPSEDAFRNGMRFRTLSTHHIETRTDSGLQVLKDHLLQGNLAVAGIIGYNNLNNIHLYNNIYSLSQATGSRLYWHEVAIVGFDDSLVTADGMGAFHIVNSWSAGWGDNGFFWMSYEAMKAARTSYGYVMYATDRIGYEPTLTARMEIGHSDRYNLSYQAGYGSPGSPDTLETYFNFHPMSLYNGYPYPETALILDLSDLTGLLQTNSSNDIFLRIIDNRPTNGLTGYFKSIMIEDLSRQLYISPLNIPIPINDAIIAAEETIILDYSYSPPQNITVDTDSTNGFVQLSWDIPANGTPNIYKIYLDGRLIDSTSSTNYNHFLSLRGRHYYGVSALYTNGESLAGRMVVQWTGPTAYGIPFADNFENGFANWIQIGESGIPSMLSDDPVYEGQYSVGLKTTQYDNTILYRAFETTGGADIETWFQMGAFPQSDGGGGSILLAENDMIFGTFFNNSGNPGYIYSTTPNNVVPVTLDSVFTINLNEWYKQKLWYNNGKLQFMLMDNNWNVMFNRVINISPQNINMVAFFASELNGGWNYFDKFSIKPWTEVEVQHFVPVNPTNESYALIINESFIDTILSQPGDEIAIYDNDLCVGAVIVDGEWPLEMNVWGTDTDSIGFSIGDTIKARIWCSQTGIEYAANTSFTIGDGTFGDGIFSRLSMTSAYIVDDIVFHTEVPEKFWVSNPYPNPFNPSTKIKYNLPYAANVKIEVFNLLGQKMETLLNESIPAGSHEIEFIAKNFPSGIYFYKIQAGIPSTDSGQVFQQVKKVILLK